MSNSYAKGILEALGDFYSYGNFNNTVESLILNNTNKGYLSFEISSDQEEIEIPMLMLYPIFSKYSQHSTNFNIYSKYVLELYPIKIVSRASIESAIKNIFYSKTIITMTVKDKVYYGGKGLILNSDGIPLLNISLRCKLNKDKIHGPFDDEVSPLLLLGHNIYINSLAFIDDEDLMCRNIVRKMIPLFLQNNLMDEVNQIYSPYKLIGNYLYSRDNTINNKIQISDMKDLITHTTHKNIIKYDSIDINTDINNTIKKYKDNIIYNSSIELM